jgi:hypothetical protein
MNAAPETAKAGRGGQKEYLSITVIRGAAPPVMTANAVRARRGRRRHTRSGRGKLWAYALYNPATYMSGLF